MRWGTSTVRESTVTSGVQASVQNTRRTREGTTTVMKRK